MWRNLLIVLPLVLSTVSIKVPLDNSESTPNADQSEDRPIYYEQESAIDSYLIPPDPHKQEESSQEDGAPPTYLVPPSQEKQNDFFVTTQPAETDWYPISQVQSQPFRVSERVNQDIPIFQSEDNRQFKLPENPRTGKQIQEQIIIGKPSIQLEPPFEDLPNEYSLPAPSHELQLPEEQVYQQFSEKRINNKLKPFHKKKNPVNLQIKPAEPTLALHLTPPKPLQPKHKNPTKLYPKKFVGFKPIPIPVAEFEEDSSGVPVAKPLKSFKPVSQTESEFITPIDVDDKKVYLYEQAEQKRKLKGDDEQIKVESYVPETPTSGDEEQDASETIYGHPGRNAYHAPLRQAPPPTPQADVKGAPPAGDRTEFRMHGMKGPHSYQFGYDTGKGKNRQFRFEERDNDGHVRGHYGYMDRLGKLRVVNYDAHPEKGFHAEAPVEQDP